MSGEPAGRPPLLARIIMVVAKTVTVFIAGIALAALVTNIWWRLTPERTFDILVYDQTVPDDTYPKHAILDQLLEYHRVPFDLGNNHVGASPGGDPFGEWPADQPDMIFLADNYGVHVDVQGQIVEFGNRRVSGNLTLDQALDVQRWVDDGTPAYGEFAMVTEPTPGDAGAVLEEVFGFRSTGWAFSRIEELADIAPVIKSLGPHPWPYEGPGLIAVNVSAAGRPGTRELIVLTEDLLLDPLPDVVGAPPGGIGGRAPFERWFSYVVPTDGAVVDAWFDIALTPEGAAIFAEHGLPTVFPALIRTDRTLYFGGDGLGDETPFRLRNLHGGAVLTRLVTGEEFRFVYTMLEPSVAWMVDRAAESVDQRAAAEGPS